MVLRDFNVVMLLIFSIVLLALLVRVFFKAKLASSVAYGSVLFCFLQLISIEFLRSLGLGSIGEVLNFRFLPIKNYYTYEIILFFSNNPAEIFHCFILAFFVAIWVVVVYQKLVSKDFQTVETNKDTKLIHNYLATPILSGAVNHKIFVRFNN